MSSKPDQTCPFCGAELKGWFGLGHPIYACGIGDFERSDLCREREAHRKTREELANAKSGMQMWQATAHDYSLELESLLKKLEKAEAENARLRSIAERALEIQALSLEGCFEQRSLRAELEQTLQ